MAGSTSKASSKAKSDGKFITSTWSTDADSSTQEPTTGVDSDLQPDVVKSLEEYHDVVFRNLTSSSSPSPHPPKNEPRWKRRQWMRNLQTWAKRCNRLWHPWWSRHNKQSSYDDGHTQSSYDTIFSCDIAMEVTDTNGNSRLHHGRAMIDVWSPYNIISRKFGNIICDDLQFRTPYPLINTLAGTANAITNIQARWHCVNDPHIPHSSMKFDDAFDQSEFEIMEYDAARFDVIIGRPDIIKFDILNIQARVPLAAPNYFRSLPLSVNSHTIQADEAAATLAQQQEMDEMRRDAEWRTRRDEYAHTQAHSFALDYAQKQVALYGPECHNEAYKQEHARRFAAAISDFTRLYRRT